MRSAKCKVKELMKVLVRIVKDVDFVKKDDEQL